MTRWAAGKKENQHFPKKTASVPNAQVILKMCGKGL